MFDVHLHVAENTKRLAVLVVLNFLERKRILVVFNISQGQKRSPTRRKQQVKLCRSATQEST